MKKTAGCAPLLKRTGHWLRGAGQALRTWILEVVYPENALCRACGAVTREGCLCDRCRNSLRHDHFLYHWDVRDLDGVRAYSLRPHEGIPRRLVIRLKHQAEACIAGELAQLVHPVPAFLAFAPGTTVTWVPMPRRRRRERCIDHGKVLAEAVARELNLPCRPLLLRRDDNARTQASLGKAARERNLAHAFAPAGPIDTPVLLVDDVLTTGTTARRCIAALREGGAKEITVLTVTKAMGFGSPVSP